MSYPAGTKQKASISYLDAGGEYGQFSMFAPVITAANEEAQTDAWADVLTAADVITLGARAKDRYVDETTYVVARPTNGAARELALKLIFRDPSTGQTWQSLLPTLDPAQVTYVPNLGAKDVVNLAGTSVAALITAVNALPPKNPYDYASAGVCVVADVQVVRGQK